MLAGVDVIFEHHIRVGAVRIHSSSFMTNVRAESQGAEGVGKPSTLGAVAKLNGIREAAANEGSALEAVQVRSTGAPRAQ